MESKNDAFLKGLDTSVTWINEQIIILMTEYIETDSLKRREEIDVSLNELYNRLLQIKKDLDRLEGN